MTVVIAPWNIVSIGEAACRELIVVRVGTWESMYARPRDTIKCRESSLL